MHLGSPSKLRIYHYMSTPTTGLEAGTVPPVVIGGSHNEMLMPPSTEKRSVVSEDTLINRGPRATNEDVFMRDVLIFTQTIQVGDTPNLDLFGGLDVYYEYLTSGYILGRLTGFWRAQMGLSVKFVLTVPGSCYGAYLVSAVCNGGNNQGYPTTAGVGQLDVGFDSYHNATQDVHAFLNCELGNTATFELPWVYPRDTEVVSNLVTAPGPNIWTLSCWAVSPLQSTIGTAAVGTVQVYCKCTAPPFLDSLSFQGKKKMSMGETYPTPGDTAKSGKKYSDYGKKISDGVSMLSGAFPVIAPFAAPAAAGLAAISSVAAMFGFTRESAPEKPTPVIQRPFSNLSTVDTMDTGAMVSLYESNATSIDPRIGGGTGDDPMSFASLFERWTIVSTFSFATNSTGKIKNIPVTPFFAGTKLGAIYMMPCGLVGLPFAFWRGDMEYLIYIPSSGNLEGRLQVLWDPNTSTVGTDYPSDPTHRLSNVIINLHGSSRTHIRVAYAHEAPCLTTNLLFNASSPDHGGSVNGLLVFNVNSPLTGPKTGDFNVSVIVMARACSNMRFGGPSMFFRNDSTTMSINDFVFQSGYDDADDVEETMVDLVSVSSSEYPLVDVCWGEIFESVRPLMQKFSGWIGAHQDNLAIPLCFWHLPYPQNASTLTYPQTTDVVGGPVPATFTWLGWYSIMFVGIRGSVRLKMQTCPTADVSSQKSGAQLFAFPLLPWNGLYGANPLPGIREGAYQDGNFDVFSAVEMQTANLSSGGCEFTMPYYHQEKYIIPRYLYDITSVATTSLRANGLLFSAEGLTGTGGDVFVAGGADITATRFRRVPPIFVA